MSVKCKRNYFQYLHPGSKVKLSRYMSKVSLHYKFNYMKYNNNLLCLFQKLQLTKALNLTEEVAETTSEFLASDNLHTFDDESQPTYKSSEFLASNNLHTFDENQPTYKSIDSDNISIIEDDDETYYDCDLSTTTNNQR